MRFLPHVLITVIALTIGSLPLEAQGKARIARDRNMISTEEIRASSASNAYDLVKTLRPAWLRTRGYSTLQTTTIPNPLEGGTIDVMAAPQIMVYIEGVRQGDQESLRNVELGDVASLVFLDSNAATLRYGTGNTHGAIVIEKIRRDTSP